MDKPGDDNLEWQDEWDNIDNNVIEDFGSLENDNLDSDDNVDILDNYIKLDPGIDLEYQDDLLDPPTTDIIDTINTMNDNITEMCEKLDAVLERLDDIDNRINDLQTNDSYY